LTNPATSGLTLQVHWDRSTPILQPLPWNPFYKSSWTWNRSLPTPVRRHLVERGVASTAGVPLPRHGAAHGPFGLDPGRSSVQHDPDSSNTPAACTVPPACNVQACLPQASVGGVQTPSGVVISLQ